MNVSSGTLNENGNPSTLGSKIFRKNGPYSPNNWKIFCQAWDRLLASEYG